VSLPVRRRHDAQHAHPDRETHPDPLLELADVRKEFRVGGGRVFRSTPVVALDGVSLSISGNQPEVHALVGESGSGKTTIAKLVLGLEHPTAGQVRYRGRDVREWVRTDELAYRRQVQMIFQDPYSTYNPFYRVDRILYSAARKFRLASSKSEMDELVVDTMRQMGLRPEHILGRYPHQLSGGERQRLMLCRILMIKPRLLVADEPVSMLDASLQSIFLDSLLQVKETLGLSCLYITHDMNVAHHVADTLTVLAHGSVMEHGASRELIADPLHPYSQLLIASIPRPNPRQRWSDTLELGIATITDLKPSRGCKFNPRCPHAMDVCRTTEPPIVDVNGRQVACFLYQPHNHE
jgi:oligopeptide/dipeptide ABC transporter ATP-binding protein